MFLYVPIVIIVLYSFNAEPVARRGRSAAGRLEWYQHAFSNHGIRDALAAVARVAAIGATAVALVLGTLVALAVQRFRFFGRETISFLADPADRAARAS